jgi:polyisoprenoid-binding protein YceI
MTKQNTLRLAIGVLLLAIAALVLVTCNNQGNATVAPTAPAATAVPPTATAATAATAADAPAIDTPAADTTGTGAETAAGETEASATSTFVIDQRASEARFLINETLIGIPTEVKGVTNLITGTLAIDPANPAQTTISTITIDASDLHTDRNLRDRAIRRFILESNKDEFRFITFTPASIAGLPATAAAGDTFSFQVTGDLSIKDVSQPVTFDVDVTADSDKQVTGLATATVKRSDFNIQIPSAPGVADVTDEVRLELAFTARAE